MACGLMLIAAACMLTCRNLYEEKRAGEISARTLKSILPRMEEAKNEAQSDGTAPPDYILNPNMDMPVIESEGREYIGALEVPALGIELPVISRWSYDGLKAAPCRFEGSAYLDDMIIAAHNYRSHFSGLKNLSPGDEVLFTDADGNLFRYEVSGIEMLDEYDLDGLRAGEWDLTLFTCELSGSSRVTVRCTRRAGIEYR